MGNNEIIELRQEFEDKLGKLRQEEEFIKGLLRTLQDSCPHSGLMTKKTYSCAGHRMVETRCSVCEKVVHRDYPDDPPRDGDG